MPVSFEKFTFTKSTSTAVPVSQSVTLTTAFQPKALILWTNGATGTTFAEHLVCSFGFSDGTNDACVTQESEDNAASPLQKNVVRNNAIIAIYDETQTLISIAEVTSFNSNGFTLSWTTNGSGNTAAVIHGIAIGGTDITNVIVDHETAGTTATGNKAYTGAGFQPDFMMAIADWDSYGVESTSSNNVIIGCAKSPTQEWAIDCNTEGNATAQDTWVYHRNDKVMVMLTGTGVVDEEADFVSFDANGCTWNWTNAPGFTTDAIAMLFIKGGQWDLGTATQRDNTGAQAITTAGIGTIKGAFFVTHGLVISTAGTAQAHNRLSIGGCDDTREGYTTHHDTDAAATSIITRVQNTDAVVRCITAAATATSSTTQAQADFTSFGVNAINLNWSVADTTDRIISWWAVGQAAGTNFTRAPTPESITVSDASLTRIKSAARVPSADSTTVTESSLTRIKSAARVPSADSVTITESSLTRSKTWPRVPSADSTTVTDSSLTRMLSAVRVPGTETTTVGESLSRSRTPVRIPSSDSVTVTAGTATRVLSSVRVPSTDSTTVTESSLTRLLSLSRAPSPESPTISEQLTRMLSATRVPSSDSVTAQDSSTTQMITRVRAPSTDTTVVSDISVTRLLQLVRNPSDTVVVTDSSLTRLLQLFRVPSSDTITVGESLSGGKVIGRVPNAESVTISEVSLTRLLSKLRIPATETVTVLDSSLARMLSLIRVPSSDTITVTEQVTGGKVYTRIPSSDSVTITESSLTRVLSLVRVPSSETVTPSDFSLTRIYSALRVPSQDSITTSESVTGQKVTGAQQYNRAPTPESITVSESSLTRLLSLVRVPTAEIVSIVESSLTRLLQLFRSPSSDSITVVENSLARIKSALRIPTADSVTVADSSLTRLLSALRLPSSDTITTGENLIRVLSAIRSPSTEVITTSESVSRVHTTAGQFNRSPVTEVVTVSENLSRLLQLRRVPTAETVNLNEQLSRIITRNRVPSSDSISISDGALTRVVTNIRSLSETPGVVEASLTRLLSASRSLSDTTVVSELQSQVSLARRLEETVAVTEPVISRIVTAIRQATMDTVDIDESVFFQTFHKFVFDSVVVAEQLFSEREALGGSMSYATPAEVRPLLGNIGGQRTDAQITLAIDSAYDEINRRTGRQPPNEWKDTENDFGIVKKICRFKAALEMAIGIKDFEDREWMQKEIEEMFKIIEEGEGEAGTTSTDIVGSSPDTTYALNPQGIIWSVRYQNLKKNSSSGENDTTINPTT